MMVREENKGEIEPISEGEQLGVEDERRLLMSIFKKLRKLKSLAMKWEQRL